MLNAEAMLDLNTCASAIHKLVGEWRGDIKGSLERLGTSPGLSAYNNMSNLVRQKTIALQQALTTAETNYILAKGKRIPALNVRGCMASSLLRYSRMYHRGQWAHHKAGGLSWS